MARRKIKSYLWTRTNHPDLSATIYKDSEFPNEWEVQYHEGRELIGKSYHDSLQSATSAGLYKLNELGKKFARKRVGKIPMGSKPRRTNAVKPEAESMAEIRAHLDRLDQETLYATPINNKSSGIKAWERGEVFQAVNPAHWDGSPFFRNTDAERIHDMGYRKIIVMDTGNGFDVDLVMP